MPLTKHCHQCGWKYTLDGSPARMEACHQCNADLRACLNCTHYAKGVAHECRERRADPVADKASANFCEYFDFIKREWTGDSGTNTREDEAREKLKKLFGD